MPWEPDNFAKTLKKIIDLHKEGKLTESLAAFDEIDEKDSKDPTVVKLREVIAKEIAEQKRS